MYLPKEWTTDLERYARAEVPPEVGFHKKWEIALELTTLCSATTCRAPR